MILLLTILAHSVNCLSLVPIFTQVNNTTKLNPDWCIFEGTLPLAVAWCSVTTNGVIFSALDYF
jgi:hypothetical protein